MATWLMKEPASLTPGNAERKVYDLDYSPPVVIAFLPKQRNVTFRSRLILLLPARWQGRYRPHDSVVAAPRHARVVNPRLGCIAHDEHHDTAGITRSVPH